MKYEIEIHSTSIKIECDENQTILSAVQQAGYEIPYSCNRGICGNCKGQILKGSCTRLSPNEGISSYELDANETLFCTAKPLSNLVIEPARLNKKDINSTKTFQLKINKIQKASTDVTILNLRMPIGVRAKFKAGQFLEVKMPDKNLRNYSMANPPSSDFLELHIKEVSGGKFTTEYLPTLKIGDLLTIDFPKGDFYLRDEDGPIVLLASGTGFAPIQSILSQLSKNQHQGPIYLYWGVREKNDLYAHEKIEKFSQTLANLKYIPVLSDPLIEDHWLGRTGFVHEAILVDFESLANVAVYACGSPIMIRSAKEDFIKMKNLPPHKFYSDSFI